MLPPTKQNAKSANEAAITRLIRAAKQFGSSDKYAGKRGSTRVAVLSLREQGRGTNGA